MAQHETGLGWSAKEEWLASSAPVEISRIDSVGGPDYPGQPIPKNRQTYADIISGDYKVLHYRTQYVSFDEYCAAADDVPIVVAGFAERRSASDPNTWDVSLWFISPVQNAEVKITNPINQNITTLVCQSYDTVTGLYWTNRFTAISDVLNDEVSLNVGNFTNARDALDAVQIISQPYYKLNPGYAVIGLADWYSPGGTELHSPFAIGTIPESTAITTDGTTPAANMTTFDFLYQGTRFYMTIVAGNTTPMVTNLQTADLRQFGAALPSKVFSLIASETFANIIVGSAPDPYENEAGASTEEGGDGDDQEDDPVEEETLPVPSVAGHGFCTIYVPSSQELGQMASYLWSGAFDVTQVIKLFSNPMDSILGLSAVPVSLSGTSEQIYLGGVALTGITMPKYTGRTSVKVDFGTTTITERWGSYLDYEPYTEFSIYLPFIGIKPLKADDIMGKTISLMYNIDILSGGCVAYIRTAGGSVLYEWSGQCALQIPVTARNYDNVFQTAMSVVGAVGAAVVAPASAPVLSGAVASAAVQAAATKPRIERSGTVNGITGFLGQLRPYIIRTIPEAFIPADQNKFIGYPAYINVALSEIQGYNEVDSIHLENVTATGAELDEIESILKGGVIF